MNRTILSKFKICIVVKIVICLVLFLLLIDLFILVDKNKELQNNFTLITSNTPYGKKIPLHELESIDYLERYLVQNFVPIGRPEEMNPYITIEKDIIYYILEDGDYHVKYTITSGSRIIWDPSFYHISISQSSGYRSYPTYEKGWRYAQPFNLEGSLLAVQGSDNITDFYYVKLEDIEYIIRLVYKNREKLGAYYLNDFESEDEAVNTLLYLTDNILYDKGVYLSPDLLESITSFKKISIVLLSVAFLYIVINEVYVKIKYNHA